ncbi:MAG: hypothetical protein ABI978_01625 [Chloroflexota bacterium]
MAVAVLLAAGFVLVVAAAACVAIGLLNPQLISDQLPRDAAIDAPAVGGAAVALGIATGLLGVIHLGTAVALWRRVSIAATVGVVLAAPMAILSFGLAIAALVSIASGAAPAIIMLPASVGLAAAVLGYAAATIAIMRARAPVI